MKLSQRLRAVSQLVPPDIILADVGADRGELSFDLLERGVIQKAILSDISANSLQRAKDLFRATEYERKTKFRVGPGLEVYQPGEIDYAVIAGMGGKTIVKIIENSPAVLQSLRGIIIQAMGNSENVRRALERMGFTIDEEILLWEDGHFYTIIRALPGQYSPLTEEEIFAGPCLLKRRDPMLRNYLSKEKWDIQSIIDNLIARGQGENRVAQLKKEMELIASIEAKLND